MSENLLLQKIQSYIDDNDVVLFMKGTKDVPQCGFSSFVVQTFNQLHIDYFDVNILESPEMRQAIKDFSDWPTVPQIYFKGEFMGGADIVRELKTSGELMNILKEKEISFKNPQI